MNETIFTDEELIMLYEDEQQQRRMEDKDLVLDGRGEWYDEY